MDDQNQNNQFVTIDLIDETNGTGTTAQVKLEQVEAGVQVTVDKISPIGDIRGVFFNVADNAALEGMTVTGDNVTSSSFVADSVNDLGGGVNVNPDLYDGGVEIGTAGIGTDDIQSTTFILSNAAGDLTIDQFLGQDFGLRLTSVGEDRSASSKLAGTAPAQEETTTEATDDTMMATTTEATDDTMMTTTSEATDEGMMTTTTEATDDSGEDDLQAEITAVEDSGIFDEDVYLEENPDVAEAVAAGETTAIEHFVKYGKDESRQCSRIFNAQAYLEQNADVKAAVEAGETTAIAHYLQYGQFEKREVSYIFKTSYYLAENPDVAEAVEGGVTSALKHFKKHGMKEGRKFNPLINVEEYLSLNADVAAAVEAGETSAIEHLFKFGCKEKRKFSRALDISEYLRLNPDVAAAVEAGLTTAFEHMFNFGFKELRKISKFLDLGFFAQANRSLLQSVFNVTEVSQIDATALVSYAIEQSLAQGLATSESFNLSSAIASLSGFSSQQISSLFGVSSATEVSFGSLVEFFSNLFTSLETSFTSQQISSFFGVATVGEISFESLLKFVSTSFSTLTSSSSSTSISLESLLKFISSSEGQKAIAGAMDDDVSGDDASGDDADGDMDLVLNIPLPPVSLPINPVPPEKSGEEPGEEPGEATPPIPAPTAFLDVQYIIKNNKDKLLEQFPDFDFANLTQEQVQQIVTFAQETKLNTSAFVNVSYFSKVIQSKVTSKLIAQGLTETEVAGLSQEELIKKGIELGFSPTPLIKLGWLKSANGKKLAELGINIENNLELFEFITSKKGLELGLNLSPFFNPGFAKKIHKDKIREKFNIADGEAGVAQLEDAQVLDKIFSNGGIVIDIRFYKTVHIEALKKFAADLGVEVNALTDEQITDFALNEGKEQGLALSPFKFDVLTENYGDKLKEFFGVEDVETLTEYELKQFIFTVGLELGIDISQVVDIQFYSTQFKTALEQYFGAEYTDEDVINFVFGDAAPYIDEEYYKAQLTGEEVTADGLLVKDLKGEELKTYIFTEGLAAGLTKLSAFDITKYTTDNADKLLAFFAVDDVKKLSQGQVREFMVKEGWKFGINLSDYVSAEDIELYRTENAALLKELYGVEDVSTLSAELVLDAKFGGLTEALDFDFCLSGLVTKLGEATVLSTFGVDSLAKISYKQLVEYLYSQDTLDLATLSPFKVDEYVKANGQAIADAFGIKVKDLVKLSHDEIVEFMLGEGVELGISLENFVDVDYLKNTYATAITASGKGVLTWLAEDYKTIDVGFIGYQFEELNDTQKTDILTGIGITLAEGATLSTKQLIDIAYSAKFKEVLGVEKVKLSAIDIAGYIEANKDALIDYFAAPGIKIKSGSKKFKSGSLKFGKSGFLKPKGRGLKFGSESIKLKGDKSMKLKAKSLKVKSGKLKKDQIAPVDAFDVTKLTDKQVIEFMFDQGVKLGINPIDFVAVDYLKKEFAVKIAERYGIDVTAVAELSDALVVDAMYGGLSNDIDYGFVRAEYKDQLTSKFGVAIEQVTDLQVLEYVYEVGVASEANPNGVKITPVDVEGFVKANGEAIAQKLGLKFEDLPTFSYEDVFGFILKQGFEKNLKVKDFVNFDYFKAEFSQNIVFNYREENVFNFGLDKVYEFITSAAGQGLSASPLYQPEWYRETYLIGLNVDVNGDGAIDEQEKAIVVDLNGDGKIDDVELKDFATGLGLEKGLETSQYYDFETDFAAGAVDQDKLLAYAGVQSIDEVTFSQKLEYLTSQGLIDGYVFSGLQAIKDKPENQDPLLKQTGAASLDEITPVDLYQAATELQLFSVV